MSEATIEYKNGPNESTAYAVSEGQKTKVQMVATPAGDLELADNPNVDTGYIVIDGKKHKCALVAEVAGELKLPTSATDDTGYIIAQNGKQHKVKLVANITGGGGAPATKFGVSIDNLLGNVGADGEYVPSLTPFTFDATSITSVPNTTSGSNDYFTHKFYYNKGLTGTIDLSNMTGVSGLSRLEYAFYATNVQKVITPRPLTDASNRARFEYTFGFCKSLKEIVFSDPIIGGYGHACFYYAFQSGKFADALINFGDIVKLDYYGLSNTFRYCELPDEIRFTSLTEIADSNAFLQAFADIKAGGKRFYFPALTITSSSKAFGSSSSNLTWIKGTGVEEIHFRADMQAMIESQYGYSSKFGATNATIYFDL